MGERDCTGVPRFLVCGCGKRGCHFRTFPNIAGHAIHFVDHSIMVRTKTSLRSRDVERPDIEDKRAAAGYSQESPLNCRRLDGELLATEPNAMDPPPSKKPRKETPTGARAGTRSTTRSRSSGRKKQATPTTAPNETPESTITQKSVTFDTVSESAAQQLPSSHNGDEGGSETHSDKSGNRAPAGDGGEDWFLPTQETSTFGPSVDCSTLDSAQNAFLDEALESLIQLWMEAYKAKAYTEFGLQMEPPTGDSHIAETWHSSLRPVLAQRFLEARNKILIEDDVRNKTNNLQIWKAYDNLVVIDGSSVSPKYKLPPSLSYEEGQRKRSASDAISTPSKMVSTPAPGFPGWLVVPLIVNYFLSLQRGWL